MRKLMTLVLCLLLVCGLAVTASAVGGTITPDKTTVSPGDIVTLTIQVKGDEPVKRVSFNPAYDPAYFEIVDSSCSTHFNNATMQSFMNGKFIAVFQDAQAYNGTFTLALKALKPVSSLSVSGSFLASDDDKVNIKYPMTSPAITIGCSHNWGDWTVTTAATCSNEGQRERTCSICGEKQTEAIGMKAHTPGDWTKVSDPTCTEKGKSVQKCKVCGKEVDVRYTDATGHKEGEWKVTKEPTCKDEGEKTIVCTVCGETLKKEAIPAAGHKPAEDSEIIKQPTCEEPGMMSGKCSVCGETLSNQEIPALGHDYQLKGEKKPTCTEKGSKLYVCSRDEKHTKTEEVEALGHKWGNWTDDGSGKHVRTCETCQEKESADHTWDTGKVTTEATCSKPGEKTYVCTACKATKTEVIPATGKHDFTKKYVNNGDGTHTGYCDCGEADAPAKHEYTQEGAILVKPTTSKEGIQEMLCVCGASTEKTLPKIHANYDDVPKTGDITGQLVLGGGAMIALLAAAAYVVKRRMAR